MALDTSNALSRLCLAAAAAGTSTIFTGSAGHIYTVKKIKVVNTDTANAKTIQFCINGSAAANAITPVLTIDAGGYAESDEFLVLAGTDTLQVVTSATGLTVSVYALDQS